MRPIAALLISLALVNELPAQTKRIPTVDAEILALRAQIAAAAADNDIETLEASFTPDFTHTHAVGRMDNLAARISAMIGGEITIEMAKPDEISIRAHGADTAVAVGQTTIKPNVYRWTVVYVRRDGAWRAAASHASAVATTQLPPVVSGWREYPLRDGVIAIQPTKWRSDTVDVKVPAGKGLEYKLTMKAGDALVYSVSFRNLADRTQMVSEFHGHTPQVSGVGDLMFYAKTDGSPQNGSFTAPWDGIHGWYLKNNSARDVVVTLDLAGYYAVEGK
jgi:hypothetical protein